MGAVCAIGLGVTYALVCWGMIIASGSMMVYQNNQETWSDTIEKIKWSDTQV